MYHADLSETKEQEQKGRDDLSKREVYEQKTEELILPIVEGNGFELVDVEYVKEGSNWYLRAYIDKPGGIAVDDCEVVSRAFQRFWTGKIISRILIFLKSALRDLEDR